MNTSAATSGSRQSGLLGTMQCPVTDTGSPVGGAARTRNTAGEETDTSPPQASTAELRPQRSYIEAARRTGSMCGRCGRALAPDETVWMSRIYVARPMAPVAVGHSMKEPMPNGRAIARVPTCRQCRPSRTWLPPESCDGCGRHVVYPRSGLRRRHACCSVRCRGRAYKRARHPLAEKSREKSCAVCGHDFTATRRDAQTCSSRCRQRRYRDAHRSPRVPTTQT